MSPILPFFCILKSETLMSYSSILKNLAVESGAVIEEQQASPEEITVATQQTVTELEECIADMADDVEKAASANNAAEKMTDVIESLESKIIMLRKMRDDGTNLSAASAKQFTNAVVTSLESRGFPAAIYRNDVDAMVVSFESDSRYDYSTEAEQKTESLVAKIKGMLSKALDTFIQWWKSMVSRVQGLNKSLSELGAVLVKRAKGIESNASTDRKIKTNGLYTIVKGKGDVDPAGAIDVVKAAAKDVTGIESTLANALGNIAKAGVVGAGAEALEVVSKVSVKTKIALPGGQEIAMDETGSYQLAGTKAESDGEAKALSGAEIALVGRKLIDLGLTLTISESDQKRLIGTLETSIDAVVKSLGQKEASLSGRMLKEFNKGLSVIRSGRAVLNKHAALVGKQAYRFAAVSANAY